MHKLNQFRLQVWHRGDLVKCVHPSVHPHVCGERLFRRSVGDYFHGSSPRVWGTPCWQLLQPPTYRFIPTCVGNAPDSIPCNSQLTVHPHVCGERYNVRAAIRGGNGSSPRVWGTLLGVCHNPAILRFIPTCVGNAFIFPLFTVQPTVHPHVCGERHKNILSSP